jgi:hypothetical protein
MLKFDKILTEDESKLYSSKVLGYKNLFRSYANDKFYVLGAASYANDLEQYNLIKNEVNPIIERNFTDLLNLIKNYLEKILNEKCFFDKNLSYPGFQILNSKDKDALAPLTSLHIDTPYELHYDYLLNEYKNVNFDFPLTFTLSLNIPKSGGGLYYWDLEGWENQSEEESHKLYIDIYNKYDNLFIIKNIPSRIEYENILKPKILKYKNGYMTIFKGNLLHQVIPFYSMSEEPRITLQGHGLKSNSGWLLYF